MKHAFRKFVKSSTDARLDKLAAQIKEAADHPENPEAIHDVRVAVRRLSQALRSFADLFQKEGIKQARRRLRKLMQRCGAARDYDIAMEVLRAAKISNPRLLRELAEKRLLGQKAMAAYLDRWQSKAPLKLSKPSNKSHAWNVQASVGENAIAVLPALAAELFEAGSLAAAPHATHEQIHHFRLLAKHFRYMLELFEPVYGPETGERLESLKGLQDRLGAINDCVVSLEIVKHEPRAAAGLRRLLKSREREFRKYWKGHLGPKAAQSWQEWLAAKTLAE